MQYLGFVAFAPATRAKFEFLRFWLPADPDLTRAFPQLILTYASRCGISSDGNETLSAHASIRAQQGKEKPDRASKLKNGAPSYTQE